jgi:hypothetical protein
MPLLPIDLQIMFSQMSQVGREQAVQKDVTPQTQFVQANEIVKKTEHDDKAVNQSREAGEGPEKVKDQQRRGRRGPRRQPRPPGGGAEAEQEQREIVADPELGHHVDLMG